MWAAWPPQGLHSLSWLARMHILAATMVAASAHLLVVRRSRPGWRRLLLAAPLVPLHVCAPLLFDPGSEMLSRAVSTASIAWLSTNKALALCLNRGPLVSETWPYWALGLLYTLPIYPRERGACKAGRIADSAGGPAQLVRTFVGYTVATMATAWLMAQPLPVLVKEFAVAWGLWAYVSFVMGSGAVLLGLAGLEVVPPFDMPWMSVSLADFWGRRWNNTVGLTLRCLFFDPIIEGALIRTAGATSAPHGTASNGSATATRSPPWPPSTDAVPALPLPQKPPQPQRQQELQRQEPQQGQQQRQEQNEQGQEQRRQRRRPSPLRRAAALASVFSASGLLHEVLLYYVADPYVWGISIFFIAQAPLMVLERAALGFLGSRGITLPRILRMLICQAALLAAAHLSFFPPIAAAGLTDKFCAVVLGNAKGAAAALGVPLGAAWATPPRAPPQ